jgi:hypothetical protein
MLCAVPGSSACEQLQHLSQAVPGHIAISLLRHPHLLQSSASAGVSQEFSSSAGAVAVLGSSTFEQLHITLASRPSWSRCHKYM